MSDIDEIEEDGEGEGDEHDIIISGPGDEEGEGEGDSDRRRGLVTRIYHAYRIDFEDGATKEYVAPDDTGAIRLAARDRPGVDRVQISRVRKDVTVPVRGGIGKGRGE